MEILTDPCSAFISLVRLSHVEYMPDRVEPVLFLKAYFFSQEDFLHGRGIAPGSVNKPTVGAGLEWMFSLWEFYQINFSDCFSLNVKRKDKVVHIISC